MTGFQQIALQLSFEFLEKRIQLNDLLLKLVKIVLDRITIRGPKHVQDVIFRLYILLIRVSIASMRAPRLTHFDVKLSEE